MLPGYELVYKQTIFDYKNRYKYYYLIYKFKFVFDKTTVHCMSLDTRILRSGKACRSPEHCDVSVGGLGY